MSDAKEAETAARRLLEQRQELMNQMVQGEDFKLRDPGIEQINADMAFFNKLLTTETGPRLDAVRTIMLKLDEAKQKALGTFPTALVDGLRQLGEAWGNLEKDIGEGEKAAKDFTEAHKKLDVMLGKGVSDAEAKRVKLYQDIAELEKATGGETLKSREALAAGLKDIQEDETKHQKQELEKQSREYERFAKQVQDTTGAFIFDALSGRIQTFKDLLGSVKDTFLRILSDMVAAAITKPIIIPILTAVTGALGFNELFGMAGTLGTGAAAIPGVAGGADGASGLSTAVGAVGTTSNIAQTLGLTSTGAIGSFLQTPIGPGFTSGLPPAGTQGPPMASGAFYSSTATIGQTLGAGTAGFALGQAGAGLAGFNSKRERIGSGVGGVVGGVAGAAIGSAIPVVGTALGAFLGSVAGSFLGGLAGHLFGSGKPKTPQFGIQEFGAPTLGFTPGQGITIPELFPLSTRGRNLPGGASLEIHQTISKATGDLFERLQDTVRQVPEVLQEKSLPILQQLTESFGNALDNVKFEGKNLEEQVKTFVEDTIPSTFDHLFTPFLELLQRLPQVLGQFDEAISALEQRQAQILGTIAGARQTITEALFTPAQIFETRQETLQDLLAQFRGGGPGEQAALAPQIAALTQEIFQLGTAQEVLGQDRDALVDLQHEMLSILTETEMTTRQVFEDALTETRAQKDILLANFGVNQNIQGLMEQAVTYLGTLTTLFQPIGSFQTSPGQSRQVHMTGLGLLHAGEIVSREGGGTTNNTTFAPAITVNVQVPPGSNGQAVGEEVGQAIFGTIRQIQTRDRYRQTKHRY